MGEAARAAAEQGFTEAEWLRAGERADLSARALVVMRKLTDLPSWPEAQFEVAWLSPQIGVGDRQTRRVLGELDDAGFLVREERGHPRYGQKGNYYKCTLPNNSGYVRPRSDYTLCFGVVVESNVSRSYNVRGGRTDLTGANPLASETELPKNSSSAHTLARTGCRPAAALSPSAEPQQVVQVVSAVPAAPPVAAEAPSRIEGSVVAPAAAAPAERASAPAQGAEERPDAPSPQRAPVAPPEAAEGPSRDSSALGAGPRAAGALSVSDQEGRGAAEPAEWTAALARIERQFGEAVRKDALGVLRRHRPSADELEVALVRLFEAADKVTTPGAYFRRLVEEAKAGGLASVRERLDAGEKQREKAEASKVRADEDHKRLKAEGPRKMPERSRAPATPAPTKAPEDLDAGAAAVAAVLAKAKADSEREAAQRAATRTRGTFWEKAAEPAPPPAPSTRAAEPLPDVADRIALIERALSRGALPPESRAKYARELAELRGVTPP